MPRRARAVMVLGTASSVGKSILVTALCRIFANMGIDVAPFKAQNMSLNSAATPDGLEIGRAQALQAEAARKPAAVEMNPILIKPTGESRAQIVLEGTIWGQADAWELYRRRPGGLFPHALAAYERLAGRCELVVLEGAGSPAEINLRDGDIVNLRMARAATAPCILVGDIDRGGVFASLVGTLALLEPDDRKLIHGFAINKFRGDVALLSPGIAEIERRLRIPCLGVIPWIENLDLDEEDSCGAVRPRAPWDADESSHRRLRIALLELPSLANATDFESLRAEPAVAVRWVRTSEEIRGADVVIVPGSKLTLSDLTWMRRQALDVAVVAHAAAGKPTLGICGGLQILGQHIDDPLRVEGGGTANGLGLLPISTVMSDRKTTIPARGTLVARTLFGSDLGPLTFSGYEIHVGSSTAVTVPFARLERTDGCCVDDGAVAPSGNVVGTYVHGLFDDDRFRHRVLDALRKASGLAPAKAVCDFSAERELRLEKLAAHVRETLDTDALLELAGLPRLARA
jgi:adenosylcobyric acid synthase